MLQSKHPPRKNLSNRYQQNNISNQFLFGMRVAIQIGAFQPFTVSQTPFLYLLNVFVDSPSLNRLTVFGVFIRETEATMASSDWSNARQALFSTNCHKIILERNLKLKCEV